MRILFYADGRSPTTLNWLRYWLWKGDEVHLVSSFPCHPIAGLASQRTVPVAFSSAKNPARVARSTRAGQGSAGSLKLRQFARQMLGPLTIPAAGLALRDAVHKVQPDLVHAMRIPYEGMTATAASLDVPLLISVWGNDFTLHARSSPWMGTWTRRAMGSACALHTDCQRDLRLAREWGFTKNLPTLVIPGNGGIDPAIFHPPSVQVDQPVVINPRGFRSYIRNDIFFRSIPRVLKHIPQAQFLCSSMADEPLVENWITRLGIAHAVQLLPARSHATMADIFRSAAVLVSPSVHDGTPNSVLEGMACNCFPVAGRLESLEEWITHGQNGSLVDPADPDSLANAILSALTDPGLRTRAAVLNSAIINERALYDSCMARAADIYRQLITN